MNPILDAWPRLPFFFPGFSLLYTACYVSLVVPTSDATMSESTRQHGSLNRIPICSISLAPPRASTNSNNPSAGRPRRVFLKVTSVGKAFDACKIN